ncbi:hypothetical protein G7B40_002205 [Aetokthonos hydrillicola Thurmond2011]|jgi:hypothetical protein|uniref:Uncharacterized protein n=1 Tax=Aetokthonos hydrillicola Thurmond2011 TaxID=2712845 RepID=A0AAP5I2B3_9CYAN|nr:hypothetical protein [Aetokthonos hydrillicola]MBO3464192.1 hypothetical protein [Aetokthonos hydrillicola CCALA 1050]MBW4588086.1 hypothetical protein [Aetokthonos hydrillicola CCALA 1050]MDR9893401.1 hypothetical protein [Aetokthonos hydrillicola Thurmond2011]
MKLTIKKKNYHLWILCCSLWFLPWLLNLEKAQGGSTHPLLAIKSTEILNRRNLTIDPSLVAKIEKTNSVESSCSNQKIEILTNQLLRDLPNYANRAIQRARPPLLSKKPEVFSYVLVAGKPEFTALPLQQKEYSSSQQEQNVKQVFFTTLERLYTAGKAVNLQQFHRLFLVKTNTGWRLVMMFSQTGYYPANKPPTPPQDTSNGDIAQGINAWLRDCQAGRIND